jgi:hypothetical protein
MMRKIPSELCLTYIGAKAEGRKKKGSRFSGFPEITHATLSYQNVLLNNIYNTPKKTDDRTAKSQKPKEKTFCCLRSL